MLSTSWWCPLALLCHKVFEAPSRRTGRVLAFSIISYMAGSASFRWVASNWTAVDWLAGADSRGEVTEEVDPSWRTFCWLSTLSEDTPLAAAAAEREAGETETEMAIPLWLHGRAGTDRRTREAPRNRGGADIDIDMALGEACSCSCLLSSSTCKPGGGKKGWSVTRVTLSLSPFLPSRALSLTGGSATYRKLTRSLWEGVGGGVGVFSGETKCSSTQDRRGNGQGGFCTWCCRWCRR